MKGKLKMVRKEIVWKIVRNQEKKENMLINNLLSELQFFTVKNI